MEESILQGLKLLNYHGDLSDKNQLKESINSSTFSQSFIQLVYWLVSQLKTLCNLEEKISGEADTFQLEIKGVLRELECPYSDVIGGNGINTAKGKLFTLDYLMTELQACRINSSNAITSDDAALMETDSPVSGSIVSIIQSLNLPMTSNLSQLFTSIQQKVTEKLQSLGENYLKLPLLQKSLTPKQWEQASKINDAMCQEYKMRRQVLIKRIDVTIQSFSWSPKVKEFSNEAAEKYHPLRSNLSSDSVMSIVDVLAARSDLYAIEKTSSGVVREATKCDLNKIIIGKVPDRGGRPSKTAPPPEMPKFQKRVADPTRGGGGGSGSGRGGRGGGGRGGGGRGGWKGRGGSSGSRGGSGRNDDAKMYYS